MFSKGINQSVLFVIMILMVSGCVNSGITITVVDAVTKKPIEDAAFIAYWDITHGIGYTSTETEKIVAGLTDKDGKFYLPAVTGRIATVKPGLKVYKPGYVGWDNDLVYKGYYGEDILALKTEVRKDFKWQDQIIYLEHFDEKKYSYLSHGKFLERGITTQDSAKLESKKIYENAIKWEMMFQVKERNELHKVK